MNLFRQWLLQVVKQLDSTPLGRPFKSFGTMDINLHLGGAVTNLDGVDFLMGSRFDPLGKVSFVESRIKVGDNPFFIIEFD